MSNIKCTVLNWKGKQTLTREKIRKKSTQRDNAHRLCRKIEIKVVQLCYNKVKRFREQQKKWKLLQSGICKVWVRLFLGGFSGVQQAQRGCCGIFNPHIPPSVRSVCQERWGKFSTLENSTSDKFGWKQDREVSGKGGKTKPRDSDDTKGWNVIFQ